MVNLLGECEYRPIVFLLSQEILHVHGILAIWYASCHLCAKFLCFRSRTLGSSSGEDVSNGLNVVTIPSSNLPRFQLETTHLCLSSAPD